MATKRKHHGNSKFHHFDKMLNNGTRYVFFSTLLHEPSEQLKQLGRDAHSYFQGVPDAAVAQLSQNSPINNYEQLIQSYIQALEQIQATLFKNEIAFLKNFTQVFRQKLNEIKNNNKDDARIEALSKMLSILSKAESHPEDLDYPALLTGFTMLRNDTEEYINNLQEIYKQLKEKKDVAADMTEKFNHEVEIILRDKTVTDTTQQSLKDLIGLSYKEYKSVLASKNFTPLYDTLAQQQTQMVMSLVKTAVNNPAFLDNIVKKLKQYKKNGRITSKDILQVVSKFVLQNGYQDKIDNLITNFNNTVASQEFWNDYDLFPDLSTVWKQQKKKIFSVSSIEELALTEGTRLADYFIQELDATQRQQFLSDKYYGKYLSETIKANITNWDANTNVTSQFKSAITKALRDAITQRMQNIFGPQWEQIEASFKADPTNVASFLETNFPNANAINKTTRQKIFYGKNTLAHSLNIAVVESFDFAELQASFANTVVAKLANLKERIPGKPVDLKDDLIFTVTFNPPDYASILDDKLKQSLLAKTNKYIKSFEQLMNRFLSNYKRQARGHTDIPEARRIFDAEIEKLGKQYRSILEELQEDEKAAKEFMDFVDNTFFGGISVKEYEFYHNEIGIKGGSLGGSYSVEAGVRTIMDMYDAGGLSQADVDMLTHIIYNAGPSSTEIVGEDTITKVKKILLGGAVLSMFDEGFAPTQQALKKMTAQFQMNQGPRVLELMQVGSLYIPESFVIQLVINNLKNLYMDINLQLTSLKSNSNLNISSTIEFAGQPQHTAANPNGVYNEPTYGASQRWANVARQAKENTKIYVLLIAGLLDLLENLPQFVTKINK